MQAEKKNEIIEAIDREKAIQTISMTHELLKGAQYRIIDILFENAKEENAIKQALKEAYAAIDLARDMLMLIDWERFLQSEVK